MQFCSTAYNQRQPCGRKLQQSVLEMTIVCKGALPDFSPPNCMSLNSDQNEVTRHAYDHCQNRDGVTFVKCSTKINEYRQGGHQEGTWCTVPSDRRAHKDCHTSTSCKAHAALPKEMQGHLPSNWHPSWLILGANVIASKWLKCPHFTLRRPPCTGLLKDAHHLQACVFPR